MSDIYETITNQMIEKLEQDLSPWRKPWRGASVGFKMPENVVTGNKYRGINIPILWLSAEEKGHTTHEWASFKQWSYKGEQIARGEKGTPIVYYGTMEREAKDEKEAEVIPFIKMSYVFNRCQLKGYELKEPEIYVNLPEKLDNVEQFVENTGAIVKHDGYRGAYYSLTDDKIHMPEIGFFFDTETQTAQEGYASTKLHELGHWSGNEKRLNRTFGKKFGDKAYAAEELVAEMGSAFLCVDLGITDGARPDSASYIKGWIDIMKEDKKAIFKAASEATRLCDFLHNFQPTEEQKAMPQHYKHPFNRNPPMRL